MWHQFFFCDLHKWSKMCKQSVNYFFQATIALNFKEKYIILSSNYWRMWHLLGPSKLEKNALDVEQYIRKNPYKSSHFKEIWQIFLMTNTIKTIKPPNMNSWINLFICTILGVFKYFRDTLRLTVWLDHPLDWTVLGANQWN